MSGALTHRYMTPEQRLVARRSIQPNGCWHYTGTINEDGYGHCGYKGRPGQGVHRVAYELFVGPIPPGMKINHRCHDEDPDCSGGLCLHRRCFNPEHLEAVTDRQNVLNGKTPAAKNAAKTHCTHGHEFSPENTYIRPDGARACRACVRARGRIHDAKRRPPGSRRKT